ncbi:hypothetical protein [Kordia jejudonensis]|uniref:hypothetical protein n=1 Tax=Kordia jejudonensis TaxID=1348245 RepID=UPI00062975B1|nr:hypothetical protein [Kordia jejudonensis]
MKKSYILLLLIFSFVSYLQAQQQKAEENYTTYFTLPRETLHVHLNKTSYLSGEEIWFKGYAYDQRNQLSSKATTNFNVGIYDAKGKELKRALFKGENGVTKGNFLVDSTFVTGTYYIKASTNWMKNFDDDGAFVQKIKIYTDQIDSSLDNKVTFESEVENLYDFQFLPEGGHLVANTKNNIGFKVTNTNGKGVKATGSIFNENNEEVAVFESNALGLGKFLFQPKANQKYTSKIVLNSEETIVKDVPAVKNQGISIIINNLFLDKLIVKLNTNEETLQRFKKKDYKLLIHQSGKLKTVNFKFDDGISKTITISKEELFQGVNTITLFDENENPILERLFFNKKTTKKPSIVISKLNTIKDTILLSAQQFNVASLANISISILPEETAAYEPDHTIISSFLLKPYLRGTIENPAYYFTKFDRKRQYELDVLLLTQGWSKYNWDTIFKNPPATLFPFENGITLRGKVNVPASGIDRLFMYATKNHPAQFIDLQEDQSFIIKNLYIEEDESVRFSYLNRKGIFKRPGMYVAFNVTDKEESITEIENEVTSKLETNDFAISGSFFAPDSEKLDTVVIEAEKKRKKDDPIVIYGNYTRVTLDTYHKFPFLADYLSFNGYLVIERFGTVSIQPRSRFLGTPLVIFDGVPLTDLNLIYQLSMANIEDILIDKMGSEFGLRGSGGVIKINSRISPLYIEGEFDNALFSQDKAPYAFKEAKEFYTPKYKNYDDNLFKKYGVISWIPELSLTANEVKVIKIPDTKTAYAVVYIEGVTNNGELISEKKIIDLQQASLKK